MSVFVGEHESPVKTVFGAAGMVGEAIKAGAYGVAQKVGAHGVMQQATTAASAAHHVITTGAPPPAFGTHNVHFSDGRNVSFHGK